MAKKELNKTYSTFSNNEIANRAKQVRRDNDTIKTPKCTIEDVDWAIMSYIRDEINPTIIENGQTIDIPVMYANGEKWAQVQAKGYMRDRKGKIMTPLISIRRTALSERDSLKKLDVNRNPAGNAQVLQNKFTTVNRYDRFSLTRGKQRLKEFYVTAVPEFVDVTYELLLWCEYTEQMNSVIEQIMPTGGFAWGTTWKFPTFISDYSFETVNASGEDRIVRATLPLTTKATLLMADELRKSTIEKRYSVKRIHFESETEKFDVDVKDSPPDGYPYSQKPSDKPFRDKPGLEDSTDTKQGVRSGNVRTIKGISDLSNRQHAKK
jgi:hypothetical protein